MSEKILPLQRAEDYVSLLENGRPQNRKDVFRQAILALDAKDLAEFLVEAGKAGVVNVGYLEDPFYDVLRACHNRGTDGVVTDEKLTELCRILSANRSNASVVTMIVDTMLNRRERVEVESIIAEREDETRRQAFRVLLQPKEQSATKEFERNLQRLYREREEIAAKLEYDLHRASDARTPEKIRIFNAFLTMHPEELGAIDEIANMNSGSIFKVAKNVEGMEGLYVIQAFVQSAKAGKKDDAWKKGKTYIESLCL